MILLSQEVMILMTYVTKDGNKFYPQLFLDYTLYDEQNATQSIQKKEIIKELMPAAWHPTRWWDCCTPKDEKKEIE